MAPDVARPTPIVPKIDSETEPMTFGEDIERILAPQEALGASILQSIGEADALIQARPLTMSSRIKDRGSRFKHALHGDIVDISPLLKSVYERVQGCHVVAEYDVGDVGKTSLLILKFLTQINSQIQTLLIAMKDRTLSSEVHRRALLDFQSDAKVWLVDTVTLSRPTADEPEGNTSPLDGSPPIALGALTPNSLVASIIHALGIRKRTRGLLSCDLGKLLTWCFDNTERDPTDSPKRFGTLHRISLFRSRQAPFNHEFIVSTFSNDSSEECCIRLERYPRLTGTQRLQSSGSLRMVLGGVPQGDSVSFAQSESELSSNSNLVAFVFLNTKYQMTLEHFLAGAREASRMYPNYELLTSNCRWFARRLILNVAQTSSDTVQHDFSWDGVSLPFDQLRLRLGDESFGGKQLAKKEDQSEMHNLARLAVAYALGDDLPAAYGACVRSVAMMKKVIRQSDANFSSEPVISALAWMDAMHNHHSPLPPPLIRAVISPTILDAYFTVLWELNQRADAWGCLRSAVELNRVSLQPTSLSDSARRLERLAKYATALSMDRYDQLPLLKEAADIRRGLYNQDKDRHRETFAKSLLELSDVLLSWGRCDEGLRAIQEAFLLFKHLMTQRNSILLTPSLARTLANLSIHLSGAGLHDDALAVIREAVGIIRTLAAERPEAYTPYLATILGQFSLRLSDAALHEDALIISREAVDIYRTLATEHPAAHNSDFAMSLNNHSLRLANVGLHNESLTVIRKTVNIYRALVAENPATHNDELASSLSNLSLSLSNVGHHDGVLTSIKEAADIYRTIAAERPAVYNPKLAAALNDLSINLSEAGLHDDALSTSREAVDICQMLAAEYPATYNPNLARFLGSLSIRLSIAGFHSEALTSIQKAVNIHRTLATGCPAVYNPDLAIVLTNLSSYQYRVGLHDDALATIREAVNIYRPLAAEHPAMYCPGFASSLNNFSLRLSDAGLHDDALNAIQEAVAIQSTLAAKWPMKHTTTLARILLNFSRCRDRAEVQTGKAAQEEDCPVPKSQSGSHAL